MSNQNRKRWDVMVVREYEQQGQQKSFWTKVGAAFEGKNDFITIQLDALPVDGKLVLQIPMSQEEKDRKFGAQGNNANARNNNRPQSQPRRGNYGGGGGGGYGNRQQAPKQQQEPPEYPDYDEQPPADFPDDE